MSKNYWMISQLPPPKKIFLEHSEYIPNDKQVDLDSLVYEKDIKELNIFDELMQSKAICLDIGFGNGSLIGCLLSNKNLELFGIEPGPNRFDYTNKRFGSLPNVHLNERTLEKMKFKKNSFDYIFSMAVMEHLRNPLLLIQKMNKWLKPNGKIILTFTNVDGFVPRMNLYKWRSAESVHQWLPGKKSVFKILDTEGFKVQKYFTYGGFPAPRNFIKEMANKLFKLFNMGDILVLVAKKK